ncbi:hypothetical protein [Gracilibacillus xinjiangensis]|uniref:Lipoprotein n=1 Tax=Gracilibacillus xinjiangensis TaxID=1193282 RepID=A0ABV8WWD0_9BACI
MKRKTKTIIGLLSSCVLSLLGCYYILTGIPDGMLRYIPYIFAGGGFIGAIGNVFVLIRD